MKPQHRHAINNSIHAAIQVKPWNQGTCASVATTIASNNLSIPSFTIALF